MDRLDLRAGGHRRLLDRRLDRGRAGHEVARARRKAGAGRPGRRQDRPHRPARHSRISSRCRRSELERLLVSTIPRRRRSTCRSSATKNSPSSCATARRLALLVWEPYMHNPKLRHRLHRVTAPTLFLRGESDGLVSAEYLAALCALCCRTRASRPSPRQAMRRSLEQPERLRDARSCNSWRRETDEGLAFQRERLSLSAAGRRIRVRSASPCRTASTTRKRARRSTTASSTNG